MSAAAKKPTPPPSQEVKPFEPRRGLFALFGGLNLIWIAALITMYFTTVRDASHANQGEPDATTLPGAEGSPSAPR